MFTCLFFVQVMMEQGSENSMMSWAMISRMYASWDHIMDKAVEFIHHPEFKPVLHQKFDMLVQIGRYSRAFAVAR
jgi:hypothetical protein